MKIRKGRKLNRRLNRSLGGDVAINSILFISGLFMLLPIIYSISSSLKPLDELWIYPPRFFVRNPTMKNYTDLFSILSGSRVPFTRYVFNTIFISVVGTLGHVILSSMCAYALCKHRFRGRNIIFNIIVLSLMFSTAVTTIPNFIIMSELKWVDTLASLIIPAFGSSLGLYLMKQFMEQMIPDSVLEAARIDGAGEFLIFSRIVMPMVKPAWLTLIIFSFQGLWNMGPTTYIFREDLKTLNYAMSQILAGGVTRVGASAAASVIMMIVPVTLFVLTQSSIVETLSISGMKE
ncbi:MAG TPA: carbohydrate ABC transporter permease [Bacillota bacterium]|nr:carbohydrate ABC transporter permease [Bacillota bacterium]